jgi:hypothetical protein
LKDQTYVAITFSVALSQVLHAQVTVLPLLQTRAVPTVTATAAATFAWVAVTQQSKRLTRHTYVALTLHVNSCVVLSSAATGAGQLQRAVVTLHRLMQRQNYNNRN